MGARGAGGGAGGHLKVVDPRNYTLGGTSTIEMATTRGGVAPRLYLELVFRL